MFFKQFNAHFPNYVIVKGHTEHAYLHVGFPTHTGTHLHGHVQTYSRAQTQPHSAPK